MEGDLRIFIFPNTGSKEAETGSPLFSPKPVVFLFGKAKINEKETLTNDSAAYIMNFVPLIFRESRGK